MADGLFDREGKFHVMRAGEDGGTTDAYLAGIHAELEKLFHARVIGCILVSKSIRVGSSRRTSVKI